MLAAITLSAKLGVAQRGSLALFTAVTRPERRAAVSASYFLACYLGMAIPVLGHQNHTTRHDPFIGLLD